jgi:ferritin-like metal-binding protein YciE
MNKMNQLKDLLKHEIHDLYSAEEQIIEALPKMIVKANNNKLKQSLHDHLKVTEVQKQRLDQVLAKLKEEEERKGFLAGLLGSKKCKGMQGLIAEGEKLMGEDMDPDVMDAAIVAAAQKIEHYEIASYGTARAFAEELGLKDVAKLLTQTLEEEYEADMLLTQLAESRLNKEAITNRGNRSVRSNTASRRSTSSRRSQTTTGKARVNRSAAAKKKTAKKSGGRSSRKKPVTR